MVRNHVDQLASYWLIMFSDGYECQYRGRCWLLWSSTALLHHRTTETNSLEPPALASKKVQSTGTAVTSQGVPRRWHHQHSSASSLHTCAVVSMLGPQSFIATAAWSPRLLLQILYLMKGAPIRIDVVLRRSPRSPAQCWAARRSFAVNHWTSDDSTLNLPKCCEKSWVYQGICWNGSSLMNRVGL